MKVSLYNAVSIDGFIARSDDDTNWVSDTDWAIFSKLVKEKRAIIMGRKTYEVSGEDFPYECDLNVVMTKNEELLKKGSESDRVLFSSDAPADVIQELEKRGFEECLIIGGGRTNAAFLKEKLVNEVIIDIHPIILGEGIKIFEGSKFDITLERLSTEEHKEGLVQITYRVNY